jgi:hypothetical protein
MDILAELNRWGEAGYSIQLWYGDKWRRDPVSERDEMISGWACLITPRSLGSTFSVEPNPPLGFHRTDPLAAARDALKQAGQRWPEMAVQP